MLRAFQKVSFNHLRRPVFFVGGNGTFGKTTNTFTALDDPDPVPVFGSSNTPLNSQSTYCDGNNAIDCAPCTDDLQVAVADVFLSMPRGVN